MKYQLVTKTTWCNTEQYHEIEGDFSSKEEALEEYGGEGDAEMQAQDDHQIEWYIEEIQD